MIALVYGGAASGKSEYAEAMMLRLTGPRIYVATMRPFGDEALRRVKKHVDRRREMGFSTIECYGSLASTIIPHDSAVLLECMGNLATNLLYQQGDAGAPSTIEGIEAFSTRPVQTAIDEVDRSVDHLCESASDVVLVCNDVFSSGEAYPSETMAYVDVLGAATVHAAARADVAVEVVCGIPVYHKGSREMFLAHAKAPACCEQGEMHR